MGYFNQRYPGQTSLSGSCCASCASGATTCGDSAIVVGPEQLSAENDPIAILRAQINRFRGPDAPKAFRYGATKFPATGPLDAEVAFAAVLLNSRRAYEVFQRDPSLKSFLDRASQGWASPVKFVSDNLAEITKTIAIYGDLNGVPPAKSIIPGNILGIPTPIILGLGVVIAYLLLTKKGG